MFDFFTEKFSRVFDWVRTKKQLSRQDKDRFLAEFETTFLDADVPLATTKKLIESLRTSIDELKPIPNLELSDQLTRHVYDQLVSFLGGSSKQNPPLELRPPATILFMGLQGAGKTSTIGKLVAWLKKNHSEANPPLVCTGSVDFTRPAAAEQLAQVTQAAGGYPLSTERNTPQEAALDFQKQAEELKADYLLVDTAGRMQTDATLMAEIRSVKKALSPQVSLIVIDAMTGQQSLTVGREFLEEVGFNAAFLSKCDSGARGGAALAFKYELRRPIAFIGTGEKIADLEPFYADRMASRIVGLGDIASLIERTERSLKAHEKMEQEAAARRFMDGTFTLDDFAQQLSLVNSLGSLGKVVKYLPGMQKISQEELSRGQSDMKRFSAILGSMTSKERTIPRIITAARKTRIAQGSGTSIKDVDALLARFEQSKQFARMVKKMGGFGSLFRGS